MTVRDLLRPGETILWEGSPAAGSVDPGLRAGRGFAVIWCLFVAFWEGFAIFATVESRGTAIIMPLFGLPFVAVGYYLVKQMWFVAPRARATQQYAITDRRLLFVGGFPSTSVRELPFSPLLRVQFTFDPTDHGTIRFWDPAVGPSEGEMTVSCGSGRHVIGVAYAFEGIEGVSEVVRILESQRERFSRAA